MNFSVITLLETQMKTKNDHYRKSFKFRFYWSQKETKLNVTLRIMIAVDKFDLRFTVSTVGNKDFQPS